jgi:hypothetical protein
MFENLLPWGIMSRIKDFVSDVIFAKPVAVGRFGIKWSIRVVVIVIAIILGIILSAVQYGLFYYMTIPEVIQTKEITFMPDSDRSDILSANVWFEEKAS